MLDVKFKENTKGKLLKFEFLKENSRKSSLFLFKKLNWNVNMMQIGLYHNIVKNIICVMVFRYLNITNY